LKIEEEDEADIDEKERDINKVSSVKLPSATIPSSTHTDTIE